MPRHIWGPEGPPVEAYSRITNPERFAPVHDFAETLLNELVFGYDVDRDEREEPERHRNETSSLRRVVRLVPRSPVAAPLEVAFTAFPGLEVRFGRWSTERFPACGCDACGEDADSAVEDFSRLVVSVVGGEFTEELSVPRVSGDGWLSSHIGSRESGAVQDRRTRMNRDMALAMLGGGPPRHVWEPWPRTGAATRVNSGP